MTEAALNKRRGVYEDINSDPLIAGIDEKIHTHELSIAHLRIQRCERIAKMQDIDMDVVLQAIVKSNLHPKEVLDLIVEAGRKKLEN
jgi:hypothetical protein